MAQFTIPTKYFEKLKSLGAFNKWLANFKECKYDPNLTRYTALTFDIFILNSFKWDQTLEGWKYWKAISIE